jgi:hypothetical protein
MRGVALSIVTVLASLALGCQGADYCVDGLDLGTTYRVTVLEQANKQSQYGVETSYGRDFGVGNSDMEAYTCGKGFDFVAGTTFEIRPDSREYLAGCYGRIGTPTGITEVRLLQQLDYAIQGGTLMQSPAYEVEREPGCLGRWQVGFISNHRDPPLSPPVPGAYPPVILGRTFRSNANLESCLLPDSQLAARGYCMDYFVIRLDRI